MRRPLTALVVLVASVQISCGRQQQAPAAGPAAAPAPAAVTADEKAFLALLPPSGRAASWSCTKEPRRYGQSDLWEYINGAAETYLAFGFQEVAAAGYAHPGAAVEATVDIFRMADAVSAFGIFAQERPDACAGVPVGVEGCYAGGSLTFWSGPYYVKLMAFKDAAEVRQALTALGAAVAGGLGTPGARPAQLQWFPSKNLVPRSERYVPKDVLGQSYLANAFEAQYVDGPKTAKMTVMTCDSLGVAAKALADYQTFIGTSGKVSRVLTTPGDEGFVGADGYYGTVVAARSGPSIAIVLGASSEKTAVELIQACFARMRGAR